MSSIYPPMPCTATARLEWTVRDCARESLPPTSTTPGPRLLDRVRNAIRARHCSRRTERAYVGWIRRFILFHGKRHPVELGEPEITAFPPHLAVGARVSASTQNQALSALLFLYRDVLSRDLEWLEGVVRAKGPVRLPVVLSRAEVAAILGRLHGVPRLMASLLYGSGLRLLECCRLRVKDVDFDRGEITVRDGKGQKGRVTRLAVAAASLNRLPGHRWAAYPATERNDGGGGHDGDWSWAGARRARYFVGGRASAAYSVT
jgi:integrase